MRRLVLLLLVAAAVVAASSGNTAAWTFQPVPDEPTRWLATWPGVRGVLSVRADNQSTIANRLQISTLLPGHDRITGLAVCRDRTLGERGDLLVYLTSYDDHRVWRYQLDGRSGAVIGQLQMLSPRAPRAVMAHGDDCDHVCVTGSLDDERRVAQCYRVDRALDDDGETINEWWVLVANYQWARDSDADPVSVLPQPEALVHDPRATALESSPSGSLWIDTPSSGSLTRFALDSLTGVHFPSKLTLPTGVLAQHLTWCADTLVVADATRVLVVSWGTASVGDWIELAGPHKLPTAGDNLRVVAWRHALLSGFDRLALADDASSVVERAFNRIDEAVAVGEVSPSNTNTPSSTATPSSTPSPSVSPTIAPPSQTPLPTMVVVEPTREPEKVAEPSSGGGKNNKNELWALTVLALPCCCLVLLAIGATAVGARRRRAMRATPMPLCAVSSPSLESGWTDMYDRAQSSYVAVPSNSMNSSLTA